MPSTPTTKSQVQAYKFVIRRMQSALVRRDAVMLHEPMRTHGRSMIVGAAIATIILAGALVWGLLSPKGGTPQPGILVGQQSGTVYVLTKKQDGSELLIPTFNVASARLIMLGQSQQQNGGGGASSSSSDGPAQPTVVDDSLLQNIPVGRRTGIPDGPDLIPDDTTRANGGWSICDSFHVDPTQPDSSQVGKTPDTAVLAGITDSNAQLNAQQSLVVQGPDKKYYLIYRTPPNPGLLAPDSVSNVVRAPFSGNNHAVTATFNVPDLSQARPISTGLFDAIPAVPSLDPPKGSISGYGGQSQDSATSKLGKIGDVVEADTASGPTYYLVLADGVEKINKTFATLMQEYHSSTATIATKPPSDVASAPQKTGEVDISQFPDQIPHPLAAKDAPTSCLDWAADTTSDPNHPKQRTTLTVSTSLPGGAKQPDANGNGGNLVRIGTPSASGAKINYFYMPSGHAATVRSAQGAAQFNNGPIYLISDRGTAYSIPNAATSNALGVDTTKLSPAPAAIVDVLPSGTQLDVQHAMRTWDTVPIPDSAGQYPPPSSTAGN